ATTPTMIVFIAQITTTQSDDLKERKILVITYKKTRHEEVYAPMIPQ
ncbi:18034_t:CDS:1, partial [Gigaspora rosea]